MKKMFSINLIFSLFILILFAFSTDARTKVVIGQGDGKVVSVEPQNRIITVDINNVDYLLVLNEDTVFKGKDVKGLRDIKPKDKVFVKYEINEHGLKSLMLLEKKTSD
ncbi:MAG: hypothetical protein AMJ42_03625 [Deltaproteobacteria bacterium DG_8]|nr:MAG: hypothetical protein AMJ42_03625 [Deltaproteobacteria bacterium DG_8]